MVGKSSTLLRSIQNRARQQERALCMCPFLVMLKLSTLIVVMLTN